MALNRPLFMSNSSIVLDQCGSVAPLSVMKLHFKIWIFEE